MKYTTISISPDLKKELKGLKLYQRETYEELIKRLIKYYKVKK